MSKNRNMGIKEFQPYLNKYHKDAYKSKWLDNYDHVYFDINFILHMFSTSSLDENDLLSKFKSFVANTLQYYIKPVKSITFVADGTAPFAKILTQRKRRIVNTKYEKTVEKVGIQSGTFTPGTSFMVNLKNNMIDFVNYLEQTYKNVIVNLNIESHGEGELKICKELRKCADQNQDDTHIVFSNDSDTIILLFLTNDTKNIYQMLDTKSIISIHKLFQLHYQKYGQNQSKQYFKRDFCFVNLLLGNDYVPKLGVINFDCLWNSYSVVSQHHNQPLIVHNTDNISINKEFFCDLLNYATINTHKRFLDNFYFSEQSQITYDKYINSLLWCYHMYTLSECKNYHHICDLHNTPHIFGVILSVVLNGGTYYTNNINKPVDNTLYGILTIPYQANNLLNKKQLFLSDKIYNSFPIIYETEICEKCTKYENSIKKLNKKYKTSNDTINIGKQIDEKAMKLKEHKKKHRDINNNDLISIEKYYIELCEKYIDKFDESHEHKQNKINKNKIYSPTNTNTSNTLKTKKLF